MEVIMFYIFWVVMFERLYTFLLTQERVKIAARQQARDHEIRVLELKQREDETRLLLSKTEEKWVQQ